MGRKKSESSKESQELAVKVDSKSTEPKKGGRDLNEPIYDVHIDQDGEADVVPEQAIEDAEFSPEVEDYLSLLLENLHEQLGIPADEEIPEEVMEPYFEEILAGADVEKLIRELKMEKVFGLEEGGEPTETFKSEEDESDAPKDEEFEEFFDEETLLAAIMELPVEKDGTRIWMTVELEDQEGMIGKIAMQIPVVTDEIMIKHKVVFKVILPYIETIPFEEVEKDDSILEDKPCIGTMGTFYVITKETMDSYNEIVEQSGQNMDLHTAPADENIMAAITEELSRFAARPNGYYDDTMEYWYNGQIYHEKDVIWLEIPSTRNIMGNMKGFLANLDAYIPLYTPIDISNVKDVEVKDGCRRVLSNRELFEIKYNGRNIEFFEQLTPNEYCWYLASEFAKTQDTSGYCVVCLNGKFYIPVESFINYKEHEMDDLIVMFNVTHCLANHHSCTGLIIADVGNMQVHTYVRYKRGGVFNWDKRIKQELAAYYLADSKYDPYDDPYDNPRSAYPEDD